MDIPLDEVIYFDAISSSSTGAAADADSTPTFAVYEEATDTDIGVGGNMTKRTSLTGNYRGSFTASAANGFELGKWYVVIGSATVGGIACKGVLRSFRIVAAEATAGYPVITTKVGTGTGEINVSSGKVPATIAAGDIANSAITAASIAADAITDAKVASDVTIASVTGAVGSVTGNVGGNVTGSVGSIATGGIAAASFAAGAIDAAAIATDAIGANELAASAITEIQSGLSTLDAAGVRTAVGLASANLDTQLATIAGYIDTEIATLVTNVATILAAVDTEVGAIKAVTDAITATGTGLSAIPWNAAWDAEVQSEVDDALKAALTEGYRGTGATGSVRDLLYEIIAHLGESAIASTTKTLKKLDGSTTAKTYTLDSATTPTSITETT